MTQIKNSVGKGGMNLPVETNYVQRLLNKKLHGTAHLKTPLATDGDCGANTQNAIRDYQQFILKFAHPDSLIQPSKTTISKLMADISAQELTQMWNEAVKAESPKLATSGGQIAQAVKANKPLPASLVPNPGFVSTPVGAGNYSFPLPVAPTADYKTAGRKFGAGRDGGARLHAGCDLITPPGTPVCAIADGIVRNGPYYFYNGSYALEVTHGDMVVRYGEILPSAVLKKDLAFLPDIKMGTNVKKGQVIAYIAKMTGGSSMLHFECYGNSALTGGLTDKSKSGGKYKRREDLLDPTNLLDGAVNNKPANPGNLDAATLKTAIAYGHAIAKTKGF
ncbi:MAG TPA: M23 family metallopeptidase [Cellvibrionaceae bacterium]